MTTSTSPSNHYPFLDGVRGVAALAVVFFHAAVSDQLPAVDGGIGGFIWNTLFMRGFLGVAVFFVLSGFVISHSLRRGVSTAGDYGNFMFRRLVRLNPPYWAAIVVAIAFHALAVVVNGEDFTPGGEPLSASRLIHHIFYTQELAGFLNINDVFWTLALELQFYLALGLIVWAMTHLSNLFGAETYEVAGWVLSAGALLAAFTDSDLERATTLPPIFYSFAVGILINWYWRKELSLVCVGTFLTGVGVLSFFSEDVAFSRAVALSGLVLLVALHTGSVQTWLSSRPFQFLGRVSYSLYLVHVPILGATLLIATRVVGTGPAGYILGTIASVITSLVGAVIFWQLVEKPCVAWLRGNRSKPTPTPKVANAA